MLVHPQVPVRVLWAQARGCWDRLVPFPVSVQDLFSPVWAVLPVRVLAVLLVSEAPVVSAVRQCRRLAGRAVGRQGPVLAGLVVRALAPAFLVLWAVVVSEASVRAQVLEWEPVLWVRGPTRSSAGELRATVRLVHVARSLVGRGCTAQVSVKQARVTENGARCRR